MRYGLIFTWATVLFVSPAIGESQIRINGQVIDDRNQLPIDGAEVRISRVSGRQIGLVVTDDQGRFSFTVTEDGAYRFETEKHGYREIETPLLWTDGFRSYTIEIRMDVDAVLLAPIEVLARSDRSESPMLAGFQHRLESGFGYYFRREDIERIRPGRITDVLAQVPGVHLASSGSGLRRVVHMARGADRCRADVFVDGMRLTGAVPGMGDDYTVDDAVSPAAVIGIEVYRGLSTVPAEFLTPQSRCGVVAIWTRRQ